MAEKKGKTYADWITHVTQFRSVQCSRNIIYFLIRVSSSSPLLQFEFKRRALYSATTELSLLRNLPCDIWSRAVRPLCARHALLHISPFQKQNFVRSVQELRFILFRPLFLFLSLYPISDDLEVTTDWFLTFRLVWGTKKKNRDYSRASPLQGHQLD